MRAYEVEGRVFARRSDVPTITEAREMVAKLCAEFGVEPPLVCYTLRPIGALPTQRTRSWYRPDGRRGPTIALDLYAKGWEVVHEVAHHVARQRGIRREHHGQEWAAIYVDAVRLVIPGRYADRLAAGFAAAGLRREVRT